MPSEDSSKMQGETTAARVQDQGVRKRRTRTKAEGGQVKRIRKPKEGAEADRAREIQKTFRSKRAAVIQGLESRIEELLAENGRLRESLGLPALDRPPDTRDEEPYSLHGISEALPTVESLPESLPNSSKLIQAADCGAEEYKPSQISTDEASHPPGEDLDMQNHPTWSQQMEAVDSSTWAPCKSTISLGDEALNSKGESLEAPLTSEPISAPTRSHEGFNFGTWFEYNQSAVLNDEGVHLNGETSDMQLATAPLFGNSSLTEPVGLNPWFEYDPPFYFTDQAFHSAGENLDMQPTTVPFPTPSQPMEAIEYSNSFEYKPSHFPTFHAPAPAPISSSVPYSFYTFPVEGARPDSPF